MHVALTFNNIVVRVPALMCGCATLTALSVSIYYMSGGDTDASGDHQNPHLNATTTYGRFFEADNSSMEATVALAVSTLSNVFRRLW